ncbi:MAG: hypothetical protein OEY28_10155, partial [Nitrospira sp.]|nr:hypothetical protein [Nitrospira sp.]
MGMQDSWRIEILGSVGGGQTARYTPDKIRLLLLQDRTPLEHGAQFTGRPVTKLHVGEHDIVKLRPEAYRNKTASIVAVARQALEREQFYRVHHPDKTWFVIHVEEDSSPVIGNVCPLLTPLHTILTPGSAMPIDAESALDQLMQVCRLYFQSAKAHHIRLDEGLSNFGVTQDRQLY